MPGDLVLVVEDTAAIARALRAALQARGYWVAVALSGAAGIDAAATDDPAAIILDLGLPDIDGVEVCRRIRSWSDVPIIVLTADDTEHRKVEALDEGADDYVTKPFSTPELLARLRVALRRRRSVDGEAADPVLQVGDLLVDVPHHAVSVGDVAVDLTPKEFSFLALLARHPGRVLTHRAILQAVWGPEYGSETQYLRVYASQIRKKLRDDPGSPRLITEPGVGYRLVDRAATAEG
ncbi:MAG: two-component system, OmpR family, operon response regulator KdpE [Acidimicrobiaceae bacterium]|jgi:two-component system KDP operon response regulator KdpE